MVKNLLRETSDLEAATHRLVDVANERGGKDNVTVIVVRVDASPLGALGAVSSSGTAEAGTG